MSNLVVQTNVLALNSHRNLTVVGAKQSQASARLSSGYKINSAADDAAGLAISEKMRAQIRGLDMASKNSQDGISLIQTAEGGMQEIDDMIQRIRELTVQASNDTNDFATADRKKLQDEIDQLTQGIDQMSGQVEFNSKTLLNGDLMDSSSKNTLMGEIGSKLAIALGSTSFADTSNALANAVAKSGTLGALVNVSGLSANVATTSTAMSVTTGTNATDTLGFSFSMDAANKWNALATSDVDTAQDLKNYVGKIDAFIQVLNSAKETANLDINGGVATADIDDLLAQAATAKQNATDVYTGLQVNYARIDSQKAISETDGTGLWLQTGANSGQGMNVGVGRINTDVLGIGNGKGTSSIDVNTASGSQISAYIDVVDEALQYVTSQRALLGAAQNRLDYTQKSLDISSENLSAAQSRIRDTDMAKEMMNLTAANVLQQAGVSMLSQANQAPQSILQLLR